MQTTPQPPRTDGAGTGSSTWSARRRSRGSLVAVVLGLVFGACLVVLGGLALVRADKPLPGTSVAGVDVGGLGEADLRATIADLVAARQDATVEVTAADQEFSFTPGAAGYGGDVDATVRAALDIGRGGFLGIPGHVTATFGGDRNVALQGAPMDDAIGAFVDEVASTVNQTLSVGSVRVDPDTLEVQSQAPRRSVVLDVRVSVEALTAVVGDPDPPAITFPATIEDPPTDAAALADAVSRAERAVADGLVLTANGGQTVLSPSEIATILRTEEQDGRLTIVAETEALTDAIAADLPSLEVEPRDARFELVSGLRGFDDQGNTTFRQSPAELRVVPSEPGRLYDPDVATAQVGQLLDEGVRTAELQLPVAEADLTTEQAEALGIDHLIGTFTTYHSCCQNRVANIHRIADLVRGQVLRPSETFSVNDHVGQRTEAKGFVADGAIFQGEIRDEIGGGISQFATTMYNAAFFSGIPIVEHRAHSLYISRYPLGREATLNYDSIDLEIENDTEHGIFLHTSYTDTSITVSIFGNNGDREVTAVMGEPRNFTDYSTRTKAAPHLPEGTRRTVQSGTQGYQVTVQRVISGGGADRTEDIVTTYHPRPEIIEVGTGSPPPPPPTEEPSEPPATEKPSETSKPSEEPTTPPSDGGGGGG